MGTRYGSWSLQDGRLTITWRPTRPEDSKPEFSPQELVVIEIDESSVQYAVPKSADPLGPRAFLYSRVPAAQ